MKKYYARLSMMLLFSIIFLNSCVKEGDFEIDDLDGINPTVAMPLVNAEMDVDKLIHLTDTTGPIRLEYIGDVAVLRIDDTTKVKVPVISLGKKASEFIIKVDQIFTIDFFSNVVSGTCNFEQAGLDLKIKGDSDGPSVQPISIKRIQNAKFEFINKDGSKGEIPTSFLLPQIGNKYENLLSANIGSVFSQIAPKDLKYYFEIVVDSSSALNTLDSLDLAIAINVPLKFSSNITIMDTIPFALDLSEEILNTTEENGASADFMYKFTNTFPFNLELQVLFVDELSSVVDSLFSSKELINASSTGSISENIIYINHERLKKINACKNIILRANINTNSITGSAVVKKTNKLKFNLKSKLKLVNVNPLDFLD